jgi:hypothetical protein
MKPNSQKANPGQQKSEVDGIRLPFRIAAYVSAFMCVAALAFFLWPRQASEVAAVDAQDSPEPSQESSVVKSSSQQPAPAANAPAVRRAEAAYPEPLPAIRQLVDGLVSPKQLGSGLSEEETAAWKKKLQQLVEQGAGAVPAIREFLAKNIDFDFGGAGKEALGYQSARAVMIDALTQIGGPVAIGAMTEVMQTTTAPREIAVLAQSLAKLEPDLHTREALGAAHQTLAMAAAGDLPGKDVAPLFEVFQKFGDENTAADLVGRASNGTTTLRSRWPSFRRRPGFLVWCDCVR